MSYSPLFRGNSSRANSLGTASGFINASGGTLTKATIVSVNTSGQAIKLDVSSDSSVLNLVGLYTADTPNAANGQVIDNGRLENITTSFAVGDPVYAGKTAGTMTNIRPAIGVGGFLSGDFVIFIGVIVKNEFNALLKDVKLLPTVFYRL